MTRPRRRPRPAARPAGGDAQVLPLINVAFLLLIFFLIAGAVAPTDPFPVTLPVSDRGRPDARAAPEVLMRADGGLAFEGAPITEAALSARLGAGAAEVLRLRADGAVAAGKAIALMARLRALGIDRITLAVTAVPR